MTKTYVEIGIAEGTIVCAGDVVGSAGGGGRGAREIEWFLSDAALRENPARTMTLQFVPRQLVLPAMAGNARTRAEGAAAIRRALQHGAGAGAVWPFTGPAPASFTTAPATSFTGVISGAAADRIYKYAITILPDQLYLDPIVVIEP